MRTSMSPPPSQNAMDEKIPRGRGKGNEKVFFGRNFCLCVYVLIRTNMENRV